MILPYIIPIISQLSSHWIPWNPHETWPLESPLKSPFGAISSYFFHFFPPGFFRPWGRWPSGPSVQNLTNLAARISNLGFNCVRLCYSTAPWKPCTPMGWKIGHFLGAEIWKKAGGDEQKPIGIEWNWWELRSKRYPTCGAWRYRNWISPWISWWFHWDFAGIFCCSLRPGNHGPTEKFAMAPDSPNFTTWWFPGRQMLNY